MNGKPDGIIARTYGIMQMTGTEGLNRQEEHLHATQKACSLFKIKDEPSF